MIVAFPVIVINMQAFCCLGVVQSDMARSQNRQGHLLDVYHLNHPRLHALLTRLFFHKYRCHVVEQDQDRSELRLILRLFNYNVPFNLFHCKDHYFELEEDMILALKVVQQ